MSGDLLEFCFLFTLIVVGKLKIVNNMAIKLVFQGTESSGTSENELQCYCNDKNEIFIALDVDGISNFICLDKETAVKLVKNIKLEISYIESGVNNG